MKAIQVREFGGPEVLKLEEVADPTPGVGQVVIAARAVGVNPVDGYIRSGIYGPRKFPYIPGMDGAGVVESVGAEVKGWKAGDPVYVFSAGGSYTQKIVAEQARVFALPAKVSFAQGACVGVPGATAWRALFRIGGAIAGETVLIHGATGGVGTAAVQLARAAGLKVVGSGGTEGGRKLIRQLGCHLALDHRKADYLKEGMEFTGGRGFDLVIEMLANVNLQRDLESLAPRGRVVVVGSRGKIEIDPRATMGRDAQIRGMTLMNADDAELRMIHSALYAAMDTGVYTPIVAKEMPLASAPDAHREVMENHAPGNLVLIP